MKRFLSLLSIMLLCSNQAVGMHPPGRRAKEARIVALSLAVSITCVAIKTILEKKNENAEQRYNQEQKLEHSRAAFLRGKPHFK